MNKYRNPILVLCLAIILLAIFLIKSSNIQVDNNIKDYNIKCKNCLAYKNKVLSFSDTFKIEASAVGYQTEIFELSHNNGSNLITLKPSKTKLNFIYDIDPMNVELFINDSVEKFRNEISFMPGDYKIKITSDNYFTFQKVITVNAADIIFDIDISKNLISKEIKFITSGERPYKLNGRDSIQNESIYILKKKSNTISYEKNNNIIKYEFNIIDNKTETINLDDIFKSQSVGVLIETVPVGAAIRVNNTYRGLSPLMINEDKIDKLEISAAGYNDYLSTDFDTSDTNNIFIELEPILAKVTIDSSPESNIYINNKYISLTPKILQLPVGRHSLSLVRDGFVTINKIINIENSISLKYDEILLTYKEHALATSAKIFKNKSGIELLLMNPSKIKLGSPENEKRRSRNEIQKNVNIAKHFYASKHLISEKTYNIVMGGSASSSLLPKVNIDWHEAAIFTNELSELEGLDKFYTIENKQVIGVNPNSKGYRLLTEAEWELIASENSNKTIYPWGNTELIPPLIGNLAGEENIGKLKFYIENFRDDYAQRSKIGNFKENKNGFSDIVGNVSEWVNDFYSEDFLTTNNDIYVNYLGPSFGNSHVVKGSNYESTNQTELGISYRAGVIGPSELIGFRVARWIY